MAALLPVRLPLLLLPLLLLLIAGKECSAVDANRTTAVATATTTSTTTTTTTTTTAGAAAAAASPARADGVGQGEKDGQPARDAASGDVSRGEGAWTHEPTRPPPYASLGPCKSSIEMLIAAVSSKQSAAPCACAVLCFAVLCCGALCVMLCVCVELLPCAGWAALFLDDIVIDAPTAVGLLDIEDVRGG